MEIIFVGVFGLLIGSFLNVVILRLPHEQTLWGRSMCPRCHFTLRPVDLVPVVSFLYLRGRCRQCSGQISWRYPVLELFVAVLFVFIYLSLAPASLVGYILLLQAWIIAAVCVVTCVVDFEHYLILDKVTFTGVGAVFCLMVLRIFLNYAAVGSVQSLVYSGLLGMLVGWLPFFLLWYVSRGRWMGFGDVKFMIFAGLALGWPGILVAVLLAFWLGALVSVPLLITGKKSLQSKLPFGTFLAAAVLIALLYGNSLWQWYISLLRLS